MTLLTFLFILVFLIGLFFYAKCSDPNYVEGLTNNTNSGVRCPNLLIQKGSRVYLYNSKIAKVPGVNPVEFENLEDYTEFLDWQRSQNIRCPVLYLQDTMLISKYRADYETAILNLDDLVNNLMLKTALTIDQTKPQKSLAELSQLQLSKAALNTIMKFIDSSK